MFISLLRSFIPTERPQQTVVVRWEDRQCAALASRGVTKIERDEHWEACQEPTFVLGPKPLNPFQEMDYHFYPVMLRWQYADGRKRLAWLPPEIDTSREIPKLDWREMERRFVEMILSEAVTAPLTKASTTDDSEPPQ